MSTTEEDDEIQRHGYHVWLSNDEAIEAVDLSLGVWEADDEDDLIEEITATSGWCIESIDYEIQLK